MPHHQDTSKTTEESGATRETLAFKRFIVSALLCVCGLFTIVYANLNLQPSTTQELVALLGLILAVPTGISAGFYYLRMLLARLVKFKER